MRPLVYCRSTLAHNSHCMTTSWPEAGIQMRARVSSAMQCKVFFMPDAVPAMPALVVQWAKPLGYGMHCLCGHQSAGSRDRISCHAVCWLTRSRGLTNASSEINILGWQATGGRCTSFTPGYTPVPSAVGRH